MTMKRDPLETLRAAVKAAVLAYDATNDHTRGHHGGDCVRCKLVYALGYTPILPTGDVGNGWKLGAQ